jgi:hypothetical protein
LIERLLDNWHADMPAARNNAQSQLVREIHTPLIFKSLWHKTVYTFKPEASENNKDLIVRFIGMLVPWVSFGRIGVATNFITDLARDHLKITTTFNTKPKWLLDKWSEVLEETKRELGMLGEESTESDSLGAPHSV